MKFVHVNVSHIAIKYKYSLLALATLGDAIQIEMILSVLRYPRWPSQVQSCVTVAGIIALTFANVNTASYTFGLYKIHP
jgi:hypothetical protein